MKCLAAGFLIVLCIISCRDKDRIPADVLSKKKMQAVLWDMTRAGEYLNTYVLFRDTLKDKASVLKEWYDKVYQIHGITSATFDRSYNFYRTHPTLMREVLDSITKIQSRNPPPNHPVTGPIPIDSVIAKDFKKKMGPAAIRKMRDSLRKRIVPPAQ